MKNQETNEAFSHAMVQAQNEDVELTCKLTSPLLRERKATVLANMKKQVMEKKETENGFAYKFDGSDAMVADLFSFVKTERECCSFLVYNLSIGGDKKEAWLELVGPIGAKEFITSELGL